MASQISSHAINASASTDNMFVFTGNHTPEPATFTNTNLSAGNRKIVLAVHTRDTKKPKFTHSKTSGTDKPKPTFPFARLPAEVKNMVYSYIVLQKHKQPLDTRPSEQYNEQYIKQREICHKTALSLMLVSKSVHREIRPIFYEHKSILLSEQGASHRLTRAKQKVRDEMSFSSLTNTANLAFDFAITEADIDGDCWLFNDRFFWPVHELLRTALKFLPRLQTITFRIYQPSSGRADTSIRTTNQRRTVMTYDQTGDTPCTPMKISDELFAVLVREADVIFNHIDSRMGSVLPSDKWTMSKAVYKSPGTIGKPLYKSPGIMDEGVSYMLHEVVVRRRTPIEPA